MMMSCAFGGLWRLALDVSNQHQVSCAVRRRPRVFKVHATRDDASYMTKKLLRKACSVFTGGWSSMNLLLSDRAGVHFGALLRIAIRAHRRLPSQCRIFIGVETIDIEGQNRYPRHMYQQWGTSQTT